MGDGDSPLDMSRVPGFIGWFWLNWFWVVAFPVILYLRMAHWQRLSRGKITRFLYRTFGLLGPSYAHLFSVSLLLVGVGFMFAGLETATDVTLALYWTANFAWTVIDYITGGDEPGKRIKKLARALAKKFTVAPAPRPAIDLRMNT